MSTVAEIRLWGRTIGAVSYDPGQPTAVFEYDEEFTQSGIEIAPLMMPLSKRQYSFPVLSEDSFYGLPGMLADSLPDKFGNALIEQWLAKNGRSKESFNCVERLCYTGTRGMGALEFFPALNEQLGSHKIHVDELVKLASEILAHRDRLQVIIDKDENAQAFQDILQIGTSAGGARAKAVIAWNPESNEVRSGQVEAGDGFEYWLLKFDGVENNKDRELADPKGYGAVEFAYYNMAKDCGIVMNPCRLFKENNRSHFMTKRFDRTPGGGKLHMQSLAAIAHLDFNQARSHSYEQAFMVAQQLGMTAVETTELYRRMIFNVITRNQDDHVKNISFLMDKSGKWSLSPAYDVAYSYNPQGGWTSSHQMSINGKYDNFTMSDFNESGKSALLKRGQAKRIIEKTVAVVSRWKEYAESAGVPSRLMNKIYKNLRTDNSY
ncbi:MAG: type II toxin-antitoxin system HipA family toxin, partial [Planctomycetota bacterium]